MSPNKQKAAKASIKSQPKPVRRHSESDKPVRVRKEKKEGDKIHRRSRNGCYTCRLRRKKCDEGYPLCRGCEHLGLDCEYSKPVWWDSADKRAQRKEDIKEHIKNFKPLPNPNKQKQGQQPSHVTPTPPFSNTPPSLCHSMPVNGDGMFDPMVHTSGVSPMSQFSPQFNLDTPRELYYSTPMMAPPQWTPAPTQFPYFSPFEVDIKTERQIFVNDIPTRKDSTISTFTSLQPPTPTVTLPSCPQEAWTQHERHEMKSESFIEGPMDQNYFGFNTDPVAPVNQAVIEVDDCDRHLLDHFLQNVAPLTFSILDVTQKGSILSDVVLPQLEQNKAYLHSCLSASALHLKITEKLEGEKIDGDIMRHRGAAIQELCTALQDESEHARLLEVTLAMILFQSSVGSSDDELPDIPWHSHFTAAVDLLDRVNFQTPTSAGGNAYSGHPSFNQSLAAWIDILGGTMLKRVPFYSNGYREKHEANEMSGLAQLMGCDDAVMYLISEVACLEAVKEATIKDDVTLCQYIADLGGRLSATEGPNDEVNSVFSPYTGALKPEQLRINITAVFRYAARIYLCSLVPAFDKTSESVRSLIDGLTYAMSYIPSGEHGYDRALIWPLLIAGAFSVQSSSFRTMFEGRTKELGSSAECGSWSRLNKLLQEVWAVNDQLAPKGGTYNIHWRDVMLQNNWEFLLI